MYPVILTIETLEKDDIFSKLTIKTPERRDWRCSDVLIVDFEDISDIVLVFQLLTVNR